MIIYGFFLFKLVIKIVTVIIKMRDQTHMSPIEYTEVAWDIRMSDIDYSTL